MNLGIYEVALLPFLVIFILWVVVLFDILRSEFAGNNEIIWFLAVTFVSVVGLIPYFSWEESRKQECRVRISDRSDVMQHMIEKEERAWK